MALQRHSRARSHDRTPSPLDLQKLAEPDVLPAADALLVAPATFNTLNKWAAGISDDLVLGLINEAIGLGIPILAIPYLKAALAAHPTLANSRRTRHDTGVELIHPDPTAGDASGARRRLVPV
jgi:phosphopantothenoylcysteine decarboxylase